MTKARKPSADARAWGAGAACLAIALLVCGFTYVLRALDFAPLRDLIIKEDHLYDMTFVLDQNFSRRAKGRGSAIFFHLARVALTPTAGCVAISAADMRKLAPRLARHPVMVIG